MRSLLILLFFPLLLVGAFKEGDIFFPVIFTDQFDQNVSILTKDQVVIVVFDKAGYYDVNAFVKSKREGYLRKMKIRYLNDISAMPENILKFFVKPNMQKKPFSILLVKDEKFSQKLNYRDGKITVYHLKEGKIVKIDFVERDGLEKVIEEQ